MKIGEFKSKIECVNDSSELIVFVRDEEDYRPFRNIDLELVNTGSSLERVHLIVNVFKEFKSVHFPNNLTSDEYYDLMDRYNILLEELDDMEDLLKEHNII